MEYNRSNVNFDWLRNSGMYDKEILDEIEYNNTFELLKKPDMENKLKDANFAEPLLYACYNTKNPELYEIYKCIGRGVQNNLGDPNLSRDILLYVREIEIIENTALSEDKNAILECVDKRPEIVEHISKELIATPDFAIQLVEKSPEVTKELIAANPELVNNPTFMAKAISKDVNIIKYASKEMLNNYDVFAISSKENDEVASYVLEHIEEFGDKAIEGAKDGTVESLRIDTVKMLKELLEKYDGYSDVERQLKHFEAQDKEGKYPYKAKSLVQVILKNRLLRLDENELNKIFNIVDLDKELLERQLRENSELIISQEEFGALPTPDELKRMIEKSQVEDKEMFAERLEKYERFHTMVKEHKSKEKKPKEKKEVVRKTQEERDERLRTSEQDKIATERFRKARKYIEEKETYRPKPEFLRGLLEKSELKDDKEIIAWLEQYTQYYEQIHGRSDKQTQEQGKEYVGEVRTMAFDFNQYAEIVNARISTKGEIPLSPELQKEIAEHGLPDNTRPENVQTQEQEQETARSVTALRGQKENSRTM